MTVWILFNKTSFPHNCDTLKQDDTLPHLDHVNAETEYDHIDHVNAIIMVVILYIIKNTKKRV